VDDEVALYYYGYRYYSPELGRWMSRDLIEEKGGINLFSSQNAWVNEFDPFGFEDKKPEEVSPFTYVGSEFIFSNTAMYLGLWFDLNNQLGLSYKYFYFRNVMSVEYGACCKKKDGTIEKKPVYTYKSNEIFFNDVTLQYEGGNTLGRQKDSAGAWAVYLNPINNDNLFASGSSVGFTGPSYKPYVASKENKGCVELDGCSYGTISIEIDWVLSDIAPSPYPLPGYDGLNSIQWHDFYVMRTVSKMPDVEKKYKGHQSIKIDWSCGDKYEKVKTVPEIQPGPQREKEARNVG
jgi:hypothetical protein